MFLRSLHILLVAQLLFSTCGVVINRHYCMGELKTSALFGKAKSCWDYLEADPPAPQNGRIGYPSCCDDTTQLHQDAADTASQPADAVSVTAQLPILPPGVQLRPPGSATTPLLLGRAPPPPRSRTLPPWQPAALL